MKKENIDIELIKKITGLTIDEIKNFNIALLKLLD